MTPGADVRAIDALRDWLAALATYRSEAGEALAGLRLEVGRGVQWVHDQLNLWQSTIRRCEDEVVQAKAELAARRFPDFNGRMPDTTVQERNLKRAQAKLEHATDQVAVCRRWLTHLPKEVDEVFTGPSTQLANFLDADAPRGAALLERRIDALERYAGSRTDFAATPSTPTAPTPPAPPAGETPP